MRLHRRRLVLAASIAGLALAVLPAGTASADRPDEREPFASDTSTAVLDRQAPSTPFLLETVGRNYCAEYVAEGAVHWEDNGAVTVEGSAVHDVPEVDPVCEDAEIDPEFVRFTAFIDGAAALHEDAPYQAETPHEFAFRLPGISIDEPVVERVEIAACASEGETVRCTDTVSLERPAPFCEYRFVVHSQGADNFLATLTIVAPDGVGQLWTVMLEPGSYTSGTMSSPQITLSVSGVGTAPDPSDIEVIVGSHHCVES
jgi:hypothetical protein